MQINKVNTIIPKRLNRNQTNKTNDKSTSFKGALVDAGCLKVADLIENGGLFVSFTLQDMLGTNLPRPIMGLMRNKKENKGKKNFKFAAKEMVREFTTGPSMFIIPGILLTIGKKVFGKATEVPMKLIKSFGEIHAANPLNEAGAAITNEDFYRNAFTQILKNTKGEAVSSEDTLKCAKDFAKRLAQSVQDNNVKEKVQELTSEFIIIAKKSADDAAHTDFTRAVISENVSAPFKDTVHFMMSYADDLVAKAAKQKPENIKNYVNKLATNKVLGRFGANILMYAAVMTFLQVIPILYNRAEGKDNAGLKGLMIEETLKNDKTADIKDTPQNASKSPSFGKSQAHPSFGSNPQAVVNKLTGSGLIGRMANGIEFEGMNVSFPLLLGIMGFGILLPRLKRAKDKYDREEILRRDLITCATMCFAEKGLRKIFSKANEAYSGFVLASKEKGFKDKNLFKRIFDYIRPIKGVNVLSTDKIVSKYSQINSYKDGIQGFCEFIDNQGGNLNKIFSFTKRTKTLLQSLLLKEGIDIEQANNKDITEVLKKYKESKEVSEIISKFAREDNPWVQRAKTLNARFTALSVIVLVPLFLGIFLPWINEKTTKKRVQEEHLKSKVSDNNLSSPNFFEQDKKAQEIFSDMNKFTK